MSKITGLDNKITEFIDKQLETAIEDAKPKSFGKQANNSKRVYMVIIYTFSIYLIYIQTKIKTQCNDLLKDI